MIAEPIDFVAEAAQTTHPHQEPLISQSRLFTAIERGAIGEVRMAVIAMPDLVHAANRHGETPLHRAAAVGNASVVILLISCGAQIDAVSCRGITPLHLAILGGHRNVAASLIEQGADTTWLQLSHL